MKRRTKQGLILEKLLHGMKHRYVLCWKGPSSPEEAFWGTDCYDCACCITYANSEDVSGCGCWCHDRIEAMANSREMLMFLLALDASKEMPFIPKNYEDWMQHNRKLKAEHDKWRAEGNPSACGSANDPNTCEACKMVLDMEAKHEEHRKNPTYLCGKPCHICDEWRAAHKPSKKKKA